MHQSVNGLCTGDLTGVRPLQPFSSLVAADPLGGPASFIADGLLRRVDLREEKAKIASRSKGGVEPARSDRGARLE